MSLAEPKSNRWDPRSEMSRVRSAVTATPQQSQLDAGEREEDEGATADPYFDALIEPFTTEETIIEQETDTDVSAVDLVAPRDLEQLDDDVDQGISDVFAFSYEALEGPSDNTEGPLGPVDWGVLEGSESVEETSDPEDGPVDKQPLLPVPIESEDAQENDTAEDGPTWSHQTELEVDDTELPWAKERWPELPLRVAFSPRQSLALVGSLLCAGGDATHLIGARHFEPVEDSPLKAKTRRVVCLDNDARRLLLLTTAGQLYLWNRSVEDGRLQSIAVPGGEMATSIWQLAPGVPVLLIRLDSGRYLLWNDTNATLDIGPALPKFSRLLAVSELGEPRIALWQHHNELELRVEAGEESHRTGVSATMRMAIAESPPLLAGFADSVLIGVRDHGLFLRKPNRLDFTKVPGCRRLTAMAVGQFQQRPTAFIGLFSELDDRADLVCVDLTSGRASRIAELSILTDDAGPTDDPPERARIDALSWDPSNLRLWAAGCFGLCCFGAPGTPTSS